MTRRDYTKDEGDRLDLAVLELHYALELAAEEGRTEIRETLERVIGIFDHEADVAAGRIFDKCGHSRIGRNAMDNAAKPRKDGVPNLSCRACARDRARKYHHERGRVERESSPAERVCGHPLTPDNADGAYCLTCKPARLEADRIRSRQTRRTKQTRIAA
jgi:hypothetical protein